MRIRFLLLGGVLYVLILVALGTLNGDLLALSLPLVIYLASGIIFGPDVLQLEIHRSLSTERARQGDVVSVELEIKNQGGGLENVVITDVLPDKLIVISGAAEYTTTLTPYTSTKIEYVFTAPRGYYRFDEVAIRVSDHLGIFQRTAQFSAPSRLLIQPHVPQLRKVAIRPRRTRVFSGNIPARIGGSGVDFFGVRSFHPGDPMRWINWKASARFPQSFFINEYEQERVADIGIILDTRSRSNIARNGDSLFELTIEAAAAFANIFLNDGNRVGLLMYGRHLDWTFPGYGKIQWERIMQSLARAKPGESQYFEKLDHLPTKLFPANSQLVFVSPLQWDDTNMLIRLRARGYRVLVISPDSIEFETQSLSDQEDQHLAIRIAKHERRLMFLKLRQAGLRMLDWNTDMPLINVVHAQLSRTPRQVPSIEVVT